jgi:hypothetical protein
MIIKSLLVFLKTNVYLSYLGYTFDYFIFNVKKQIKYKIYALSLNILINIIKSVLREFRRLKLPKMSYNLLESIAFLSKETYLP